MNTTIIDAESERIDAKNGNDKPSAMLVEPGNIPAALKEIPRWLAWNWRRQKNGRWSKPPLNVKTGCKCSKIDPKNWVTFDEAIAAHQSGRFDGIGFEFEDTDDFAGIDLDDCRNPETGELTAKAEAIVDWAGSYTEVSPSGRGVKIFIRGKLPWGNRAAHNIGVETYERATYFCVTGNHVDGTPADIRRPPDLLGLCCFAFGVDEDGRPYQSGHHISDRDLAVDALSGLDKSRAVGYHDWIRVGIMLHGTDASLLDEWDDWSRAGGEKYSPGECAKKWKSFGRGANVSTLGIGSLIYLARQDGWRPPWERNGHALNTAQGAEDEAEGASLPITREDMLRCLNRAFIGQFGGRVEVASVEKLGSVGGRYDLIQTDGSRVILGGIKAVMSMLTTRAAIADQTRILIRQNKRIWPKVANCIIRLAEIKETATIAELVTEWLQGYVAKCSNFCRVSRDDAEPGSDAWRREKYPQFGARYWAGCLRGEFGELFVHLEKFTAFCRAYDRGGLETKPADIQGALVQIGFQSGVRLQIRVGKKQINRRAWVHPRWFQEYPD